MMNALRRYIISVMKDEKEGGAAFVVKALLSLFSCLYGLGIKAVDMGYKSGVRKVRKARVPVISVGNLTLGGTGKTPFSAHLADTLGVGADHHPLLREEGAGGGYPGSSVLNVLNDADAARAHIRVGGKVAKVGDADTVEEGGIQDTGPLGSAHGRSVYLQIYVLRVHGGPSFTGRRQRQGCSS